MLNCQLGGKSVGSDHCTRPPSHPAISPAHSCVSVCAVVWANRSASSLRLQKLHLAYWDARMSRSLDRKYVKAC